MEQEQTWVDRLVQPARRTIADVQETGAELLQQPDDGAATLTSAQKRSLREVLAGLGSPEIRTITGITPGWTCRPLIYRAGTPTGLSSLPEFRRYT